MIRVTGTWSEDGGACVNSSRPTTRSDVLIESGIGFLASAGQVLTGRNVGKSTMISGGITYQFGLWNKSTTETINN